MQRAPGMIKVSGPQTLSVGIAGMNREAASPAPHAVLPWRPRDLI
ncbi:MAG: hypothetical protein ACM3ZD_07310 [Betaproteobacteria bacterium]